MKYISLNKNEDRKSTYQREVKLINLKRAFDLIRSGRCVTRAAIAKEMQLSATAVSSLTDELVYRRLIMQTGHVLTDAPGRRAQSLKINEAAKQIVVFSLGASGLRYTLYDLGLHILEYAFYAYEGNCSDQLADIFLHRAHCLKRDRLIAVCVSMPDSPNAWTSHFSADNFRDMVQSKIPDNLSKRIDAPIFVAHRSTCLAYAEMKLLADRGEDARNLVFVHISDSVGSAMICDGELFTGANDTAGDIAHLRVGTDGLPCECGGEDCLCHYLNLPRLLSEVQSACETARLPIPRDFFELAAQYGAQPAINDVIDRAAHQLSSALATLIYVTSADRIVIGGGIRALGERFLNTVSENLNRLNYASSHSLSYSKTDDSADSLGAAHYLLDRIGEILFGDC